MKIDTKSKKLKYTSSEHFEEKSFGIKKENESHIIQMLRQQLYKYPIDSICREVASNSRDANREVGLGDVPVKITIGKNPFLEGSTCITFEDCGPGISAERMEDVFLSYGASTKRGTNNQTGGFGLGAKTPFAYSNSFSIETVAEGKRYTYLATAAKGNNGAVILLSEEETDDISGTKISIPIKPKDIKKFETACIRSTYLWKVRPEYINFSEVLELRDYSIIYDDKFMSILNERERSDRVDFLRNTKVGALIDGIPYELESQTDEGKDSLSKVYNRLTTYLNSSSSNKHQKYLFLKFNTGELGISPNRENLHYDDKTRKAVAEYLKKVEAHVKKDIKILTRIKKKIHRLCLVESYKVGSGGMYGLTEEEATNVSEAGKMGIALVGRKLILGKKVADEYDKLMLLYASVEDCAENLSGISTKVSACNLTAAGLAGHESTLYIHNMKGVSPLRSKYINQDYLLIKEREIYVPLTEEEKEEGVERAEPIDVSALMKSLGLPVRVFSKVPLRRTVTVEGTKRIPVRGIYQVPGNKSREVCFIDFHKETKEFYLDGELIPSANVYPVYSYSIGKTDYKYKRQKIKEVFSYNRCNNTDKPILHFAVNRSHKKTLELVNDIKDLENLSPEALNAISEYKISDTVRDSDVYSCLKTLDLKKPKYASYLKKLDEIASKNKKLSDALIKVWDYLPYEDKRNGAEKMHKELSDINDALFKDYPLLKSVGINEYNIKRYLDSINEYIELKDRPRRVMNVRHKVG